MTYSTSVYSSDCTDEKIEKNIDALKCLQDKVTELSKKTYEIPKGAVLAFNLADCPKEKGWYDFNNAESRYIVGVGNGSENGLSNRFLRQTGGLESIKLSVEQIPRHQHNTPQMMDNSGTNFGLGPRRRSVFGKGWADGYTEMTSWVGNGSNIDITPPFIALKYCIKK